MTFQFKIQLKGITKPPVWRKVSVPAKFTFLKFHEVIQAAFGWGNYHLFQFSPKGYGSYPSIGLPDPEGWGEDDITDSRKIKLKDVFSTEGEKYTYIYDFGDDWEHKLVLERILPDKTLKASCLDGKGACPPEDCGGVWGYQELKEVMADPSHPEHESMKEWLELDEEESCDPAAFDLKEAREMVRLI